MRDLTARSLSVTSRPFSKGIAFQIADLVFAKGWSEGHALQMAIRLDHGAAVGEDYEEVLIFESKIGPFDQLILWRNTEAVFVQPLLGRARHYDSVTAALESLCPPREVIVTDIIATAWPTDQ